MSTMSSGKALWKPKMNFKFDPGTEKILINDKYLHAI